MGKRKKGKGESFFNISGDDGAEELQLPFVDFRFCVSHPFNREGMLLFRFFFLVHMKKTFLGYRVTMFKLGRVFVPAKGLK